MQYLRVDPLNYPIQEGESWWVVHPNRGDVELCIPSGACAVCTDTMSNSPMRMVLFNAGVVYEISSVDKEHGLVAVKSSARVVEMPLYVFARYFDAEAFVKGIPTPKEEKLIKTAKPFDYLPTLPVAPEPESFDG